jgi:hypothetical protein
LDREDAATVQKPVPRGRKKPMMAVPKWTTDDLLRFRGINPEDAKDAGIDTDPEVIAMADAILSGDADWLTAE